MNRAVKVLTALIAVGVLVGVVLFLSRPRSVPPVTVKVRIAVTPQDQSGFVVGQLNSARFKYFAGKQAGITPALAQRLSVKLVPNSPLLEAQVHLSTKEEAQKYVAGFLDTLQMVCGTQAQVALTQQSIR
jgi:hypothetical protein